MLFDSPQSTEFEIDREYVGRVVGSGGTQINKIRDSLGVVIHFDQESEWTRESSKKKREKIPQKSRVKVGARSPIRRVCWLTLLQQITGRKENVEEAKKRILSQVDRYVSTPSPCRQE